MVISSGIKSSNSQKLKDKIFSKDQGGGSVKYSTLKLATLKSLLMFMFEKAVFMRYWTWISCFPAQSQVLPIKKWLWSMTIPDVMRQSQSQTPSIISRVTIHPQGTQIAIRQRIVTAWAKGRSIIIDMSGNWVHISLGTSARGYFILDFLMTRVSRLALLALVVYAKSTWVSVVTESAKTMPMSAQSSSIAILMFIQFSMTKPMILIFLYLTRQVQTAHLQSPYISTPSFPSSPNFETNLILRSSPITEIRSWWNCSAGHFVVFNCEDSAVPITINIVLGEAIVAVLDCYRVVAFLEVDILAGTV